MKFKWKEFGKDLRYVREELFDISLREAARQTKITHSTWWRAENGLSIEAPTFLFLCEWSNNPASKYMIRRWAAV